MVFGERADFNATEAHAMNVEKQMLVCDLLAIAQGGSCCMWEGGLEWYWVSIGGVCCFSTLVNGTRRAD